MHNFLLVIPARYNSKRLPGKPLIDIKGIPMVLRTYNQCKKAVHPSKILIATDHKKIFRLCRKKNINVIMTSKKCLTGTDRIAEVAKKIKKKFYINVQGDEPIVNPLDIKTILEYNFKYPNRVAFGKSRANFQEFNDYSKAKVVCSLSGRLLYSSRAGIPLNNKGDYVSAERAIWIYAFNKKNLKKYFDTTNKRKLEHLEDNEIIGFLEIDIPVYCIDMIGDSWAVDEKKDIEMVENILKERNIN